jgi:hypothetical protein
MMRPATATSAQRNGSDPLVQEANQLVKIVATIIRNNSMTRRAIITAGVLGIWILGFGISVLM